MSGLKHYKYIDALRGFAFLGVLTIHASNEVKDLPFSKLPVTGEYGVQLFFLLSAVTLLRSVAVRSGKEVSPTRNFFIRRFFRIAPLFWGGLVFYAWLDGSGPRYDAPNGLGAAQYLSTLFFVHGWAPTTINGIVPGGWSIAVEMTFYLCLPLLAGWVKNTRQAAIAAGAAAVGAFVLNLVCTPLLERVLPASEHYLIEHFLFFWFPNQLPVFLLGFALYYALHDPSVTTLLAQPRRPMQLLAVAAVGWFGLTRLTSAPLVPAHLVASLLLFLVILALAARPYAVAVNRLTCGLGTISFSCYLTHFAVLRLVTNLLTPGSIPHLPASLALVARFGALWIGTLLLTVPASIATYLLIEKPGMELGKRLIRLLEGKREIVPASATLPAASGVEQA